MTAFGPRGWDGANQQALAAALAELRDIIAGQPPAARAPGDPSSALERLAEQFALTGFERDLLLLCAGMELDAGFAQAVRAASRGEVTFGFALAALPGAHWSALAPTAPLRLWRLIEMRPAETLTTAPLRIDERILHQLAGVPHLDERLHGVVSRHRKGAALAEGAARVAARIAALWAAAAARGDAWPCVQILSEEDAGAAELAAAACAAQGLGLCVMQASDLPTGDGAAFERLWAREAALSDVALLVTIQPTDGAEVLRAVARFVGRARSVVLVAAREPLHVPGGRMARFDLLKPSRAEQVELWRAALRRMPGDADAAIADVTAHFDFGAAAIATTGALVAAPGELWEACRAQARGRLDDLAERISGDPAWDDLVLPPEQARMLREIVACVRQRATVYERWGFAAKSPRGLGVSALFAGPSGTGKTLAAEIVARELRLDLYRIDLSQVVSKYIGETEKNLHRVFAAAETAGAVLLFDEADALFGKRSEVKDSHDRYANMEVSYLLQRMEQYRGLAILTTNLQQALDPAFRRRIRFIVTFPFPDEAERAAIWARVFPQATPVAGLEVARLARLNVAGGNIRNIALGAAFLAADEGGPVTMGHLLRTARAECAKLGRPLTEAEVGGWV